MHKKYYRLALITLVAVAAVWLYAIGRSAGELLALLAAVPAQPAVTIEAPSEPLVAPSARRGDEWLAADRPAVAPAEPPPVPAPRPVAPRAAQPAPAVYADADNDPAADGAKPIDHPEITDPRLRKLLQPAWDD